MPIKIKHGKPETMLTAAQLAGQARKQEEIQKMQMEFDYRQSLRQQDMAIDLQMQERAKLWEIDKMQLRSQIDFQREEQLRQRKLDSIDSAMQQVDKEVLAGRITEQEAYPIKQKLELSKVGVSVPVSAFPGDEEDRYGVQPYWMRGRDAPEGTPERQLYEAKMAEQISGERRGVVPYYLDPTFIGSYPEAARQAQEARGIFLSDEDFNDLARGVTAELPLDTKSLDVGVRAEEGVPIEEGRVRVISPKGQTGTILRSEISEYRAAGFEILDEPTEGVEPVGVKERLEAGEAKFYKPSLRTFATMSPLRYLMERRKAKKLVR